MRRALILAAALVGCGRLGFDDSPRAGDARIPDSAKPDTGPACAGHAGPSSVYILAATPFCIDATEATNEQYAEFLGANPAVTGQPPECSWKTTYVPGGLWPFPLGSETLPVASMDWCDARTYCMWAGKRLCGQIGGGSVAPAVRTIPSQSEWSWACTGGGAHNYPYGTAYVAGTCVDSVYSGPRPAPVASAAGCTGGFPGLFDMSGNITEWENSCDATSGAADGCYYRGGEFAHLMDQTSCAVAEGPFRRDDDFQGTGGIRCCSDPL